jgi:formylglycine-generating enzyme required for sulfatase activity
MKRYSSLAASVVSAVFFAAHASQAADVDFVKEVQPILESNCVRCHLPGTPAIDRSDTEYLMDTRENALKDRGIIPGDGAKSKLYKNTIRPDDDDKVMPPQREIERGSSFRLTKEESETLKKWIDEGAKWPDDVKLIARKKYDFGEENSLKFSSKIHEIIIKNKSVKTEAEMKPRAQEISGTDVKFELLPIPGGKFKIGSPENEAGRNADEGPQREVTIAPFWMGKTEVTWDEYNLYMHPNRERVSRMKRVLTDAEALADQVGRPTEPYMSMDFGMGTDGFPAISMTQHAANKYCQWLSAKTGHFYRLPTEAEWEFAARAGTTTAYYWGDDASKIKEHEWWGMNSDFKYQKVGRKKPNPWGLHDMLGNVSEWTLDQYDAGFYTKIPAANPWNKATKPYPHSIRGGSWDDEKPDRLRSAVRNKSSAEMKRGDAIISDWYLSLHGQTIGMRIIRPLKTPTAEEMHHYWNSGVEKDEPHTEKAQ